MNHGFRAVCTWVVGLAMSGCWLPSWADQSQAAKVPVNAKGVETWICTFPSGLEGDKRSSIQKWTIHGSVIAVELFPVPVYDVLQNNKFGVIGVHTYAEMIPGHTEPTLGAHVFLIDKTKGIGVHSITSAGKDASLWRGTCVLDDSGH